MIIEVRRKWETGKSVCGEMYIDNQFECYTLEPARTTPVHLGHPCIPAGEYKVILSLSPHLKYVTPELLDVPGRSAIRIHIGNYPKDVLGCTAVGEGHETDAVTNSHAAFDSLMTLLRTANGDLTARYTDPLSNQ